MRKCILCFWERNSESNFKYAKDSATLTSLHFFENYIYENQLQIWDLSQTWVSKTETLTPDFVGAVRCVSRTEKLCWR